ncbi:MAG TPA: porphobilinogen synthase [Methanomicrobiales archaeon]|nr:porphobilinogen synthase [Methanomicrobiales archaeon]
MSGFPARRMRRYRQRIMQELFTETRVRPSDLVMPLFIDEGISRPAPISTMPGQSRFPVGGLPAVAGKLDALGLRAAILFGIPKGKDPGATRAYAPDGVIQRSVRAIKKAGPDFVVATDVCACEYTDHGHCGIIGDTGGGQDLLNDPSLELMNRIAVSHAEAGADIVAPSCMLDGMVGSIRMALDDAGFENVLLMSYSGKFASGFYGPFREAADSGYIFGDRTTYQLSPANAREAFMESALDAEEGADILMVKPAGYYLDILSDLRELGLPLAAYQVSGEYAMIRAAADNGWIDRKAAVMESLTCIRRAGADLVITYFADEAAGWMREEQ